MRNATVVLFWRDGMEYLGIGCILHFGRLSARFRGVFDTDKLLMRIMRIHAGRER